MVNRRTTRTAGVALVDVLVATVMIGVSIAILLGLAGRAISAQTSGENLQTAAMLLDEQLNLVLARGADDYASRYGQMQGVCEAPFENFSYELEISGGGAGEAFNVVATVSWKESGQTKSASVETRIAPRLGDEPDPDRKPPEQPDRMAGALR